MNTTLFTFKASKNVSFLTSADRPIYPMKIPHDKFGNEFNPWHGTKEA